MNITISQVSWFGQDAWVIENETIRTVIVPSMGAKIVSLFDKRTQLEWLVDSGDRPLNKVSYGANFIEQDMSGWDEIFPTIIACTYPGPGKKNNAPLPDHGEVWPLTWVLDPSPPNILRLSIEGKALPYRLTRTISFSTSDTLLMTYELENIGRESMPYIWAAHPQFVCDEQAEIMLPPHIQEVCNTIPAEWGWGEPETRFAWPEAVNADGQNVRIDRTGPPTLQQGRKFFVLPDTHVNWAGLIRQPAQDWIRLEWQSDQVPYFSLWVDEGAFSHQTVVALEPTTGFYDSLTVAWEKNEVTQIRSGEIKSWTLSVRLGTRDNSVM